MPKNRLVEKVLLFVTAVFMAVGCTYSRPQIDMKWDCTPQQRDSIEFAYRHHFTENCNFLVSGDSVMLLPQSPADVMQSLGDTAWVVENDMVVVADIVRIPGNNPDSVWVKIARDQMTIGWVSEKTLLENVTPDDPISQFIHIFGNRRIVVLCCISVIAVAVMLLKTIRRKKARIVHFNDIDSIYPTLFCIDMALIAIVYASIQHFVPQTWQEFYFHPTLNPFSVPPVLSAMIVGFWGLVLLGIAAFDDAVHKLEWFESVPYLFTLAGMAMVVYLVFAATTMIYVGYPLFAAYVVFAFVKYRRNRTYKYVCGKCGHKLRHKGTCPFCGARNV